MKLKSEKLEKYVFRLWYYFRAGYGTYLTFIVGLFTFASTTYYLAIRSLPFLQGIFPHFYVFIVMTIILIGPAGVFIGWLHMKGTLAFPMGVSIGIEANPYTYKMTPGIQTEVIWPLWAILLPTLQKFLEKENVLSPEEKKEFENVQAKIERLLKGEAVGVPRSRKLSASWKQRKSDNRLVSRKT